MSQQKKISVTVPIPVRWYMFEIHVKEEASHNSHGMISLESSLKIGLKLGMDRNDVIDSVTHLYSMTLFLYFSKILPNVIFTNPQYLLDLLSTLIRLLFVDCLEEILPKGQYVTRETQLLLREKGLFEKSLLDKLKLPFVTSLFTEKEFLDLLQYLYIIAPLTTPDSVTRYFIPVALPPCQLMEEDKTMFMRSCDPMIITFQSKVVPQGVFPSLVVALINRYNRPHFFLDSSSPSFPRQLRYAVRLYSEDLLGSVLLVDTFKWIEVYFIGLTRNCPVLRQVIKDAIKSCTELLAYDDASLEVTVTLPCYQKHVKHNIKFHGISLKYDRGEYIAQYPEDKDIPPFIITNERQVCWLQVSDSIAIPVGLPDGPLNDSHLPGLVYAVREVYHWDILGEFLGVSYSTLRTIEQDNYFQTKPARRDMLTQWISGGRASKNVLIDALKLMNEERIALEIKTSQ